MVLTPCVLACFSMAAPEALSRLTIARTVTPLVTICWAMVCIFCASPWAFWMLYLTPAFLNAASSCGRTCDSQRGEDTVSGRMTPIVPAGVLALEPPLELPPLAVLLLLPPHAATVTRSEAERAGGVRMPR